MLAGREHMSRGGVGGDPPGRRQPEKKAEAEAQHACLRQWGVVDAGASCASRALARSPADTSFHPAAVSCAARAAWISFRAVGEFAGAHGHAFCAALARVIILRVVGGELA
jgi:hypothetical protein